MISVVIPNFNSGDKLVKNLPKLIELLKKSKLKYEIIVVDDASTDNSIQIIETAFSRGGLANVITKPTNTGFGMTVDAGIRRAKGEIVFVLNLTDILPESSDYFKIMLKYFEKSEGHGPERSRRVFSVAAVKRDEEDHGNGQIYFEKGFFLHRKGPSATLRTSLRSAWADGGAQAIRKEYYLKIGGFDPLYKFYWEDVDLGYRAWKAGYQVDFEPKAILLHKKVEGPIAKFYSERTRRVMNLRNQMIFTYKNADPSHLFQHCFWWPYHMMVALKNRDWGWFDAYWQAIIEWPRILLARSRQKKITKLTDDEVLNSF